MLLHRYTTLQRLLSKDGATYRVEKVVGISLLKHGVTVHLKFIENLLMLVPEQKKFTFPLRVIVTAQLLQHSAIFVKIGIFSTSDHVLFEHFVHR